MASGRPDWFGTIVAAGKYDTTFIPIALDADGFITATMKGLYDAALKTIAVDSSGVMKANIAVQDLDFLTVRPAYGESTQATASQAIAEDEEKTLVTVNDQGIILGGHILWGPTTGNLIDLYGRIYTEESLAISMALSSLYDRNIFNPGQGLTYLLRYDPKNKYYGIGISPGTTFETKLEIKAYNAETETTTVSVALFYAVTP